MTSQVDCRPEQYDLGNLDDVLMSISVANTETTSLSLDYELGNFDSVWSFLHPPVQSADAKQQKRIRKRDARRLKRQAKHAIADADDIPDMTQDTSASDNDGPTTDEDIVDELDILRSKLHSAQKSFKPRHVHVPLPHAQRVAMLHNKLATTTIHTLPAHIFVDSSNIFLGFQSLLQEQYPATYPPFSHKKPFMDLSVLSTILERGRKTSVKSLVGSSPLLQSWDAAKCLGYEVSILERVSKGTRKSEQGVDELLHLKMLESICDHEPSHMVLATGDANIAQFSGGFYHCVIRALSRGWTVDLVSFCGGMSRMWENETFRKQWGSSFNIIYLDDYIDELEA